MKIKKSKPRGGRGGDWGGGQSKLIYLSNPRLYVVKSILCDIGHLAKSRVYIRLSAGKNRSIPRLAGYFLMPHYIDYVTMYCIEAAALLELVKLGEAAYVSYMVYDGLKMGI